MQNLNPCILMCNETCLTNKINDFEVDLKNYKLERCDSHSRHMGGVAIYVKNKLLIIKFCLISGILTIYGVS